MLDAIKAWNNAISDDSRDYRNEKFIITTPSEDSEEYPRLELAADVKKYRSMTFHLLVKEYKAYTVHLRYAFRFIYKMVSSKSKDKNPIYKGFPDNEKFQYFQDSRKLMLTRNGKNTIVFLKEEHLTSIKNWLLDKKNHNPYSV